VFTSQETLKTNTLEFSIFWPFFKKSKNGQSGVLNTKTCLKAGLGGRKHAFLGYF
jgi:hypothetical protein